MTIDDVIKNHIIFIEGVEFTFDEILGIDETDLGTEFTKQSARYGFVSAQEAIAEQDYILAKQKREELYSQIALHYRLHPEIDDDGKKIKFKVTEGFLKDLVMTDEEYIESQKSEAKAMTAWKTLRNLALALRQRGDMMVSLGATLRREWDQIGVDSAHLVQQELRKAQSK